MTTDTRVKYAVSKESVLRTRIFKNTILQASFIGILSSLISITRITGLNPENIKHVTKNNVWAEDGLFPLCIVNNNFIECLLEPYAGYFLLTPKLVSGITAITPIEHWGLVTNLVAAVLTGVASFIIYYNLKNNNVSIIASASCSLVIVTLPIVGLEAVNVVGSLYIPLLTVATVLTLNPKTTKPWVVFFGIILTLSILTIPSSIVLAIAILVIIYKKKIPIKHGILYLTILCTGLLIQYIIGLQGETQRNKTITFNGITAWNTELPKAITTYIPGLNFEEQTTLGMFTLHSYQYIGLLTTLIILILGIVSILKYNYKTGILLLAGLGYGLIPVLTGYGNNRYFVLPLGLWLIALILELDSRKKNITITILVIVLTLLWLPSFQGSDFRSKPGPNWLNELERVRSECSVPLEEKNEVAIRFTPEWPRSETVLENKTNNIVNCENIF